MAQSSIRSDLYRPQASKTFAANATAVLHSTDAPTNAQVLPCGFIPDTAAALTFKDVNGVSCTMTAAAGIFCPVPIAQLTGAGPALTVFWNTEP